MVGKLVVFLSLAVLSNGAVVPALPAAPVVATAARLEELDAAPQYSFAYDVQDAVTGDSKAQYETRNGDVVQGSYSLIEADGTRRIVEYTADPINGFNAVVSREPATAVAAIAAPLVPYAPAIAPSVAAAPVLPAAAAPVPAIPASGPDSDVEVVEARSGPLVEAASRTREEQLREQQQQLLQQLRQIELQQQTQLQQQLQQLQQLKEQSRLQLEQQNQQRQQQRLQVEQKQQQQQRQQPQQQQQQQGVPVKARATLVQPGTNQPQRLISLPAAQAITNYASYPNPYAYTAAYTSPVAYAAPISGLTYAPANALL